VSHARPFHYILTEVEPAQRYTLQRRGQDWKEEFATVSAAYFFARAQAEEGEGQMLVVDMDGNESTLYLF
jgi:hypothetical protein